MKHISNALLAFAAANLILMLVILYWWIFDNSIPPFIAGRPKGDAMFSLGLVAAISAFVGAMIKPEWNEDW